MKYRAPFNEMRNVSAQGRGFLRRLDLKVADC